LAQCAKLALAFSRKRIRAQEGFRRIRGHKEMGALAAALGRSNAGERLELAAEQVFIYQISLNEPAEILTI
jgi:hypothetical protein